MNKINTDIISTTGININKYDILPSKVFINGVEITDTESWNNAINKIDEKDKEIERLNNKIARGLTAIDIVKDIIIKQPSSDNLTDLWILSKLEGISNCLKDSDKE